MPGKPRSRPGRPASSRIGDPVQRVRKWIALDEFDYVVKASRRKCGIPPNGDPSAIWPEQARSLTDLVLMGGMWKALAVAAAEICIWLDVDAEGGPHLAKHLLLGMPLPGDFPTYARELKEWRAHRDYMIRRTQGAEVGTMRWVEFRRFTEEEERERKYGLPNLRDLPLLLFYEETKGSKWAERCRLWNRRFPRSKFSLHGSMKDAYYRAHKRLQR